MSEENLWTAWNRFRRGKRRRPDVIAFERRLDDEITAIAADLVRGTYQHGAYDAFIIRDPKVRIIHKATVRDRVVHQALYDALTSMWERRFLPQSYGCRLKKGVHRAIARVAVLLRSVSGNGRREAWVLHGDIAQFFPSIDHAMLLSLLQHMPMDGRLYGICAEVIGSYAPSSHRGLPLGNLTSQLFGNVYLHELDRFVIHELRRSAYVRYADDFFLVSDSRAILDDLVPALRLFLADVLHLTCSQLDVRRWSHGADVLGAVLFPWGAVPRRRQRLAAEHCAHSIAVDGCTTDEWRRAVSYLGMLERTRSVRLREQLRLALLDRCVG
ncbi:MAG: reverse transcriptase/maturase family protein [Candidatus Uhrbacteria bacterium]